MSFFYNAAKGDSKKAPSPKKHIPIELMNQMGCKACPMDKVSGLVTPKMPPSGTDQPLLYILGEAPGETEDKKGEPFVGDSGKLLRKQFSRSTLEQYTRINNVIRCHPESNQTPELAEIECCRGYIVKDIEDSKPLIVAGAGNIPLAWATGLSNVLNWRGKLVATKIGNRTVWYFPFMPPSYVLRKQSKHFKHEVERLFEYDLQLLEKLVRGDIELPAPYVHEGPYDTGIQVVTGESSTDFNLLEDMLNKLSKENSTAIDLETTGLRPYPKDSKILTCAIGTFDSTVAFALDHPDAGWSGSTRKKVWGLLCDYLLFGGRKIAHNVAFEMEWLAHEFGKGALHLVDWDDTMSQAHTIDERPGKGLDDLTRQYFGFFLKDQSNVDVKRLLQFPLRDVLRYNGMDSKWTHKLDQVQRANPEFVALSFEHDRKMRLAPSLVATQLKGVDVDMDYATSMQDALTAQELKIQKKIASCPEVGKYQERFGQFSPSSNDDVVKLMKDICKRSEVQKELGGTTSDEAALSKIPAHEVPSAPLILELRTVSKLLATYVKPVVSGKVIMPDGKIHTQYSSMVADTGRLNSEDPNMQNFPKRKNKEIRGMIAAPADHWIAALDYGQIEARVIAMASEDRNLVKYLWTDYDIHGFWADRFIKEYPRILDWVAGEFGVDRGDDKALRKTLRQEAKNRWVFPQFFGSSYRSCAPEMHVPEDVAKDLADEFWSEFAGVQKWQNKMRERYEKNLYVETLTGRRRRGALSWNQIINTPIQGTAADIVTDAMEHCERESFIRDDDDFTPEINVHDDLTFLLPDSALEEKLDVIIPIMCEPRFDFINVPIMVEVSLGKRWHEIEEVGKYRSTELFNIRNPYERA